ncbi:MAG: beta-lactamase family protein [Alphaproteobacteria bacterium]|nr:beta-lactamase family protein [Alphaproteobacteria bacterium]
MSTYSMLRNVVWVVGVVLFGTAADAGARLRPLDGAMAKVMDRGWPGVSVLVEYADGRVETATSGLANIETNAPMTADTGFHLCSVNKALTAVALLRLVDQGKVSLDQKVTDILEQPVVKRIPHINNVTVRMLLDHSSGIYPTNNDPDYIRTLIGEEAFSGRVWTPEEMVELATRPQNKPEGKPGEGHHYSDTNYVLAGMIVARVAGEPYKTHIARTIFRPLGMERTYFYSDVLAGNQAASATVANGYLKLSKALTDAVVFNRGFKSPREGWLNSSSAAERIDAAGGTVTTLPDLRKFAHALFRGQLMSARSQAFMTAVAGEVANAEIGKHKTRALQGAITTFGLVIYKEGDGPGGFNTLMAVHPKSGTVFLGFTNQFGDFDEVDAMMTDIMGAVTPR